MNHTSLLFEIDRIAEYELRPFLAPIVDADTSYVFTVQGNAPYFLKVKDATPGWWIVNPMSTHTAELEREAMPHEYIPYLDQLPRRTAYTLFQSSETSWMCLLCNSAEPPVRLHLVRDVLVPLEAVRMRRVGDVLLYGETVGPSVMDLEGFLANVGCTPNRGLRNAARLIITHRRQVEDERHKQARAQMVESTEDGFRRQLQFAGADLDGWRELPNGYQIRYSLSGLEMPPLVLGRDGKVVTAGICLDGTDRYHNLSSIVHVMQRARQLQRFDLDEELWL